MKLAFLIINLSALLLNATWAFAGDSSLPDFYDFENLSRDREYVAWDHKPDTVETYYRKKTTEHLGAMLIKSVIGKPLGYGQFEVMKDGKLLITFCCPNPRCNAITEMHTCAFNNCYFRIKGQKKDGKKIQTRWEKIDDKLVIFRNGCGMVNWNSLTLETRKLSDPPHDEEF